MNESEQPVYIVLGAYGTIGSELLKRLHNRGAHLVAAGRSEDKLSLLADSISGSYVVCDARVLSEVEEAIDAAYSKYGRLDGIANCVGSVFLKPAHLTTLEEWNDVILTNLASAFNCIKCGAQKMRANGGSIVLVSSVAANIGLPNHEAIAAAKAGVQGLALSAAATYARSNIRVNCVAPGLVDTQLTSKLLSNPTQAEASRKMHPLGRIGGAGDIASVLDWLLGQESQWVTGQVFKIDGGLSTIKAPLSA